MKLLCLLCILCGCAPRAFAQSDESAILQAKIDKTPARGILSLEAGRTYTLTRPLRVHKSIWIRTNKNGLPATLHCPAMAENWMAHLQIEPRYGPIQRWSEKLLAGQRPKGIAIIAGKSYLCGYGVNPYALGDPGENHYRGFSDASGLPPAPRDIRGEQHWCKQILTSPDGSIVQDIRFTSQQDVNIDYALGIQGTRGAIVHNLSFNTRTAIAIMDCRGIAIDGVSGKVNYLDGQSASGRLMTCWQSMDISIANVDVEASDWASLFMAEAWCDGISYDNVNIKLRKEKPQWPPMPIWFSNGGARNQLVRAARIEGDLYLHDSGGADYPVEPPRFQRIEFTGANWRPDIAAEQLVRLGQ